MGEGARYNTDDACHKDQSLGHGKGSNYGKAEGRRASSNAEQVLVWGLQGMKQRCYNPKHVGYGNYGGRGITICDEWLNSFSRFYEDIGPRPSLDHEIDRIDNDGNYEPSNCRWAVPEQQTLNRRGNRRIEYGGKRLTVVEWARRCGMRHNTLSYRLDHGWSVESALTVPVPCRRRNEYSQPRRS
jgi:hypothetical protein